MTSVSVLVASLGLFGVNSQGIIPGVANQCFEPVSRGPCRAFIPSFYFNPLTGACDCFVFGGCQANNNKFGRLDECMNTCSVRPQLQIITPTCIRIFGADNANFVQQPRPITPRPIAFSTANPLPIVTDHPAVPAKAITTAAAPIIAAPTTSAPVRPAAPVVPARPTSNIVQTSGGTTIQKGNLVIVRGDSTTIVGSIFSNGGVSGQTSITIGQPVFIGRSRGSNDDEDDK